mmetsp:Transcript_21164/g.37078  ORF Transcript_21164/g.37078 Transcript_21164/m.37078 type:complete len:288 (-) Transcript_21164:197-1060(-)
MNQNIVCMPVPDAQHMAEDGGGGQAARVGGAGRVPGLRPGEPLGEEVPEGRPEVGAHLLEGCKLVCGILQSISSLAMCPVIGIVAGVGAQAGAGAGAAPGARGPTGVRQVGPEGRRVLHPLQHAGVRGQGHYGVCGDAQAAGAGSGVGTQQRVRHPEGLAHHRVLPQVVLALDELPVLPPVRPAALDDLGAVDAGLGDAEARGPARRAHHLRVARARINGWWSGQEGWQYLSIASCRPVSQALVKSWPPFHTHQIKRNVLHRLLLELSGVCSGQGNVRLGHGVRGLN